MTVFDPLNDKIGVYSELLGEIAETNSYSMVLRTLMSGGIVTLTPNQATGQLIIDAPNNYYTSIVTDGVTLTGNGTAASPLVSLLPPIVISPSAITSGTIETLYHVDFSATGGAGSGYVFSIIAGTLPKGMSLSSTGSLTGTPLQFGTYHFTVMVTDIWGITGQVSYTLALASIQLTVNPGTLPSAYYNSSYSTNLTTPNGTGGDIFAVETGSLPPGLSFASSGAITGTPTSIGSWTFTVSVIDSAGDVGSNTYTLTVLNNLAISPTNLASGSIGVAYIQNLSATGGTNSGYGFSIVSGSLPSGLSLSGATISGTPNSAGTSNFTIQVNDSANNLKNFQLSITVNLVTLGITPSSLWDGSIGYSYAAGLSATGGLGSNYNYWLSSGNLPSGLGLSGNTISGTITGTGTFYFTISFSDSAGDTGSQSYAIYVPAVSGGEWIWDGSTGPNFNASQASGTSGTSPGIPGFNWLTIEVWGAGGGGASNGSQGGARGGDSACGPCWAGGGGEGQGYLSGAGGGSGGGASGGGGHSGDNVNGNGGGGGNGGTGGSGGDSPAGGGGGAGLSYAGAYPSGGQGNTPGGGGAGGGGDGHSNSVEITGGGGGGGAGGYSRYTWYAGELAPGTTIGYTAGGGGGGGWAGPTWKSGAGGGGGRVKIYWG